MAEKLRKDLVELKAQTHEMGRLAERMLRDSLKALKTGDDAVADAVIADKKKIREMDAQIEDKALKMIALYQPVAGDLRAIACSLKIITYIARIGRYAKDIAMIEEGEAPTDKWPCMDSILKMSELSLSLIEDALTAYETSDETLLADFSVRDDIIDDLRYAIFSEAIDNVKRVSLGLDSLSNQAMVARYLERCGDHACKIAEKVHYMITGERTDFG